MYVIKTLNGDVKYRKAPDGGWGFVIVIASFFLFGISYSTTKSLGFYFKEFQTEFNSNNYETSWILSITLSLFGLGAPFATPIQARYGARKVIMFAGFLSMFGMIIASTAQHIFLLYLGIGVICGLGFSWTCVCTISQVGIYFDKYRAFANGITSGGSAVCSTLIPYLCNYLLPNFGWRGSILIYAGFAFNIAMLGALIRPIKIVREIDTTTNPNNNTTIPKQDECMQNKTKIFKFLKKYWVVFFLGIPEFVGGLAYYVPVIYIVPYAKEMGLSDSQAAQLLSMTAIADIVARPAGGLLISMIKKLERNIFLYMSATILCMALLQFVPLYFTTYYSLLVYTVLYGGAFGLMVPGTLTSVPLYVGSKNIQTFFGAKFFMSGLSTLIGPPIAGHIVDISHTYKVVYWYCACCLAATSLLYLLSHLIIKRRGGVLLSSQKTLQERDQE